MTSLSTNAGLVPGVSRHGDETAPTTPRNSDTTQDAISYRVDDSVTPTRATFAAAARGAPVPETPSSSAILNTRSTPADAQLVTRGLSIQSFETEDVEMGMDDGSDGEGDEASNDGSLDADGTSSSKKKKTQRFWCTDYPPCNLSFTRSEHLARHIRKHTGERPFQCHCSRRFSRLDNLRQHAQTVHVNEDIPGDSLAASGTRFQRQVRTDRVRPPASGNRSRTNTASSQSSLHRGHQRNSLSASSISSVGSNFSVRDDIRRRPPPQLVMGDDGRHRVAMENFIPDQQYRVSSPGAFSPAPSNFSGHNSPQRWNSVHSPSPSHSRAASLYNESRAYGRRMSMNSGLNAYYPTYGPPPPIGMYSSNMSPYVTHNVALPASPTSSHAGSVWSRRDSISSAGGDAETWRRRTWHPESQTNFTSRLVNVTTAQQYQQEQRRPEPQYHQVQNPPPPPPDAIRLPGISSFDPLQRPATPPRRQPSPPLIETPSRVPFPRSTYQGRRPEPLPQFTMPLHRDMNRLELEPQRQTPQDGASVWADEVNSAVLAQADQSRGPPMVRFEPGPPREQFATFAPPARPTHVSAPPITPREAKRRGWYAGPISTEAPPVHFQQRISPEGSSSSEGIPGTPGSASVTEYQPRIVHSSGWVESTQNMQPQQHNAHSNIRNASSAGPGHPNYSYGTGEPAQMQSERPEQNKANSMLRLEALVAVATSEGGAPAY